MLTIGAIGEFGERSINRHTLSIYQGDLVPILQITEVRRSLHADLESMHRMLLKPSPQAVTQTRADLRAHAAAADTAWAGYYPTITDLQERRDADALVTARAAFTTLNTAILAKAAQGTFDSDALLEDPTYRRAVDEANRRVASLYVTNREQARGSYEHSETAYRRSLAAFSVTIGLGVVLAFVLLVSLLRAIARPLDEAVAIASDIAAGELNHAIEVRREDEIGRVMRALARMDQQLAKIVTGVRNGAQVVSVASARIAQGNDDLSLRAQAQASSLEETAAAMEQMAGSVQQNATTARDAAAMAAAAHAKVEAGQAVTEDMVAAMAAIEASSRRIVDIIEIMDSLAFQTNILSLNAAVEAGRAGAAGRSFAVVAKEVRELATRSASSAKAIRALIDESSENVQRGGSLVAVSASALLDIRSHVHAVTAMVSQIASTSAEQAAGIEQVNAAVATLDASTQHTAALVEESAAASRSLEEQARVLLHQVNFFRIKPERPLADGVTAQTVTSTGLSRLSAV